MSDPMAALKARFLARLAEEAPLLEGDLELVRPIVHRLAGAAGVFGFAELSRAAAAADDELQAGGGVSPDVLAGLKQAVQAALRHG